MDRTLLVLLAEAWKTGEPGDVAALVDRIKEVALGLATGVFQGVGEALLGDQLVQSLQDRRGSSMGKDMGPPWE
jgi:hypothetical protein